jgi:hypothetical protein
VSERARPRRHAERGTTERAVVDAILDEGLVAHVGFVVDGQPYVIPMGYARDGDRILLHGSVKSRLMSALAAGVPACVTVTHLDGVVLARSTFHSSMNYRSAVVFGATRAIEDPAEKRRALDLLTEHLIPGRGADARGPDEGELAATQVVELSIEEATAKVRTGPPKDRVGDERLPIWAGVVPLAMEPGEPEPAPDLPDGIERPDYVAGYRRGGR